MNFRYSKFVNIFLKFLAVFFNEVRVLSPSPVAFSREDVGNVIKNRTRWKSIHKRNSVSATPRNTEIQKGYVYASGENIASSQLFINISSQFSTCVTQIIVTVVNSNI